MKDLLLSEKILYGGIAVMVLAVVLAVVFIIIFSITGRKIQNKLEQEYGKPV